MTIGGKEKVCWREYNEFALLADRLSRKFKSAMIPPLPPAFGVVTIVSESMIQSRLVGIRAFTKSLLRHPFLRNSVAVDAFLDSNETINEKRLDAILQKPSKGFTMWLALLKVTVNPEEPLLLLKEVHKEIDSLSEFYASLVKEMKSLTHRISGYASRLKEFNLSLEVWRNVERTDLHRLSAAVALDKSGEEPELRLISSFLQDMQGAHDANRERVLSKAEKTLEIMKKPIKYEMRVIDSVARDIDKVKAKLTSYEKAVKVVKDLEADKTKTAKNGSPSKDSSEKKMSTSISKLKVAEEEKDMFLRGLLVIELNRFRYERGTRNAKLLRDLADLQAEVSSQEAKQWSGLSNTLPITVRPATADRFLLSTLNG